MSLLNAKMDELKGGDSSKYLIEDGMHKCLCVALADLGVVETSFGDKSKIEVCWATDKINEDNEHFIIRKQFTASTNEKAKLTEFLNSAKLKVDVVSDLLGTFCQIITQQEESQKGKTFANIKAFMVGKPFELTGTVKLPHWYAEYDQKVMLDNVTINDAPKGDKDELPF